MSFNELCKKRYSVRSFSNKKIPKEKLRELLTVARCAPSAKNFQPTDVLLLTSDDALEKIRSITPCAFNAPCVLVFCSRETAAWKNPFDNHSSGEMDASIMATHFMLAAADCGLGTTWVCFFDRKEVVEAFSLPENTVPYLLMPVGYPTENAVPSENHSLRNELSAFLTEL